MARSDLQSLADLIPQSSQRRQVSQPGFGQRMESPKQLTGFDVTS